MNLGAVGATTGSQVRLAVMATAGVIAVGMLLATPATADEGNGILLELSRDGVNFTSGTVSDIFALSSGMVPGESRRGTVWVRNASSDAARFSLAVDNTGTSLSPVLPDFLSLEAASLGSRASMGSLPGTGNCGLVIDGWALAGGNTLQLDMNLNLALAAPNATRNQESTFELVFLLQGISNGSAVSACATPDVLPETVAIGTASVMSGTTPGTVGTTSSGGTVNGRPRIIAGNAVDVLVLPADGAALATEPTVESDMKYTEVLTALAASNVESNSRTPWPWLLVLSAATYMAISMRRRRKLNEPAGTFHPSE